MILSCSSAKPLLWEKGKIKATRQTKQKQRNEAKSSLNASLGHPWGRPRRAALFFASARFLKLQEAPPFPSCFEENNAGLLETIFCFSRLSWFIFRFLLFWFVFVRLNRFSCARSCVCVCACACEREISLVALNSSGAASLLLIDLFGFFFCIAFHGWTYGSCERFNARAPFRAFTLPLCSSLSLVIAGKNMRVSRTSWNLIKQEFIVVKCWLYRFFTIYFMQWFSRESRPLGTPTTMFSPVEY